MGRGEEKEAYDGIGILDRYRAHDVASYFKTDAKEDGEEVVCSVFDDCLVELDGHGD